MPRGVYERSESHLEGMRQRWREQGAKTKPSDEAKRRMSEERTRHGHARRRSGQASTTYMIWSNMLSRCANPNASAYRNYGGRGVMVCDQWAESFEDFLADMGPRPEGKTLDRIDVNGNYEPGNCRWATPKEQGRNTRFNHLLTLNGRTMCIVEWAEETGISNATIWARIMRLGWSTEEALTRPVRALRRCR